MELQRKNLDTYSSFIISLPRIKEIITLNKLLIYQAGILPTLESDEISKIETFIKSEFSISKVSFIISECLKELEWNVVNIHSTEQLDRYWQVLTDHVKLLNYYIKNTFSDILDIQPIEDEGTPIKEYSLVSRFLMIYQTAILGVSLLNKKIASYKSNTETELQGPETVNITAVRHKIVLLHETGVFEFLFKKYFNKTGTGGFNELLRVILNLPNDVKTKETLRSDTGKLINGNPDEPLTSAAVRKVKSELAKIDIY